MTRHIGRVTHTDALTVPVLHHDDEPVPDRVLKALDQWPDARDTPAPLDPAASCCHWTTPVEGRAYHSAACPLYPRRPIAWTVRNYPPTFGEYPDPGNAETDKLARCPASSALPDGAPVVCHLPESHVRGVLPHWHNDPRHGPWVMPTDERPPDDYTPVLEPCPECSRGPVERGGVWVAYTWDRTPIVSAVFADEVDALRHALASGWADRVVFLPYGADMATATARKLNAELPDEAPE